MIDKVKKYLENFPELVYVPKKISGTSYCGCCGTELDKDMLCPECKTDNSIRTEARYLFTQENGNAIDFAYAILRYCFAPRSGRFDTASRYIAVPFYGTADTEKGKVSAIAASDAILLQLGREPAGNGWKKDKDDYCLTEYIQACHISEEHKPEIKRCTASGGKYAILSDVFQALTDNFNGTYEKDRLPCMADKCQLVSFTQDSIAKSKEEILKICSTFRAAQENLKPKKKKESGFGMQELEKAMMNTMESSYAAKLRKEGAFITLKVGEKCVSCCSCGNVWESESMPNCCGECGNKNNLSGAEPRVGPKYMGRNGTVSTNVIRVERANIPGDFVLVRRFFVTLKSGHQFIEVAETYKAFLTDKEAFVYKTQEGNYKTNEGNYIKISPSHHFPTKWESIISQTPEEIRKVITGTPFEKTGILKYLNFQFKSMNDDWAASNLKSYTRFALYPIKEMFELGMYRAASYMYVRWNVKETKKKDASLEKFLGVPKDILLKAAKDDHGMDWFEAYQKNIGKSEISYENAKWLISQRSLMENIVPLHRLYNVAFDDAMEQIRGIMIGSLCSIKHATEVLFKMYEITAKIPELQKFSASSPETVYNYGKQILNSSARLASRAQNGAAILDVSDKNGYRIFWADEKTFKSVMAENFNSSFARELIFRINPSESNFPENIYSMANKSAIPKGSAIFLYLIENADGSLIGAIAATRNNKETAYTTIFPTGYAASEDLQTAVNQWIKIIAG